MGKTNLKFRVYVRSFRYIVSGQALITCSLLHGYTKKETDTEKEKKIFTMNLEGLVFIPNIFLTKGFTFYGVTLTYADSAHF